MEIKDVLKKLNKDKLESDKVGYLEDMPDDFLSKGFISTGSPLIDYITGGGNNRTGLTLVTGWESSGKSSLLLTSVREAQTKYPDKTPVIFDGEGSITDDYLDRMGVDKKNLILRKDKNLESMLDEFELFAEAEDLSVIGLDSVKSFFSSYVEAKSAEDNTMGIEAKRWNARMPIITSKTFRRGIPLIFIHQWREDPGKKMGDPRNLSGGKWVKYMPDQHIDITKKDILFDEDKKVIGHKLDIRIKKSKHHVYDPKSVYTENFYYQGGFNKEGSYSKILIDKGVIEKSGGWYQFPDQNGEQVKLQGEAAVISYLKEHKDNLEFLKSYL